MLSGSSPTPKLKPLEIIAAAKDEAERIVEDGRRGAGLPAEALAALQATVGEFGRTNNALVQELSMLADTLAAHRQAGQGVATHLASDELARPGSSGADGYGLASESDPPQMLAESPIGYWTRLRPTDNADDGATSLNGVTPAGWRMR